MERGLSADRTTIWRWVQRYAPELNKRCRLELKPTNGSWRVDETYICQGGSWRYLYRASTGATIDFWFSAERDAAAAAEVLEPPDELVARAEDHLGGEDPLVAAEDEAEARVLLHEPQDLARPAPVPVDEPRGDGGGDRPLARELLGIGHLVAAGQRLEALDRAGMHGVVVVRFTPELSRWEPETFVEKALVEWVHAVEVWVGANFLFGRDRTGNFTLLRALGIEPPLTEYFVWVWAGKPEAHWPTATP